MFDLTYIHNLVKVFKLILFRHLVVIYTRRLANLKLHYKNNYTIDYNYNKG